MQAADDTPRVSDPCPDAELIYRVRRGEHQAYGTLVERYERTVLAAALVVVRDVHVAQDVAQDVFVACYTRLHSLRDPSRFGAWLLKAAEREAVHVSRRVRRMRVVSATGPGGLATPDAPREPLLNDERELLLRCVRSLPPHERLAVSLRYFEGHSVHDVARATGLAVGTVTKQLSRALSRLREQLDQEQGSWRPKTNTMKSAMP